MLQVEHNFFQVHTIKTGHMSIIYPQTGDILLVSSKCTAQGTDENFKINLQILQVLTPKFHSTSVSSLYAAKDDFNASLQ